MQSFIDWITEIIEHLVPIPDGSAISNTSLALSVLITVALVVALSTIYGKRR